MPTERRFRSRYPIALNVRYQTIGITGPIAGVGQTINISSNGMLLACARDISEGARLKICVEWPSLLNGITPLQLITVGTVVRCTEVGVSVVFDSYQFKTMSRARNSNAIVPELVSQERASPSTGVERTRDRSSVLVRGAMSS
jgi:hypothetical protein